MYKLLFIALGDLFSWLVGHVVISDDFGDVFSGLDGLVVISDLNRRLGVQPSLCTYHILDYFRRLHKFGEVSIYLFERQPYGQ